MASSRSRVESSVGIRGDIRPSARENIRVAEIVIVPDIASGGALAADEIERLVVRKPDAVLGLATGSTPLAVWNALAGRGLDMSEVHGFALDEYIGLAPDDPCSYRATIDRDVIDVLGLDPARVHVPGEGHSGPGLAAAGDHYEDLIAAAGGVDHQVLGIGRTGHIGFNEPGSSFASRTRVKSLMRVSREDNARFFDGDVDAVPRHCVTQGLGTILDARSLVLLAFGRSKAAAIAAAVEGPVTASMPASAIQLHRDVRVIVDEAAAVELRFADYYRETWHNRPAWAR